MPAATIINGMRPRIVSRALGICVRVAGRIVGQRVAAHAQSGAGISRARVGPAVPLAGRLQQAQAASQAVKQIATQARQGAGRGIGGILRPFQRVGGIVWLEVTGFFFLLFAAIFTLRLWQNWAGFSGNPIPRDFAVVAAAVFLYLGISAFWRARRR